MAKKFGVKRTKTWQSSYKYLFSKERGAVTINFGNSAIKLPAGSKLPEQGDVLFGNYAVAVYTYGMDVYLKAEGEIISPAIGLEERTLMNCWRIALADYFMEHEEHYHNLHASWYEWVEAY